MTFILVFLGFIFVVLCVFLVIIILAQPGKSGGGLSGLGGGAAGSALSETLGASHGEKTLVRWTSYMAAAFFVIAFVLTLIVSARQQQPASQLQLPGGTPPPAQVEGQAPAQTAPTGEAPAQTEPAPEQQP